MWGYSCDELYSLWTTIPTELVLHNPEELQLIGTLNPTPDYRAFESIPAFGTLKRKKGRLRSSPVDLQS